MTNEEIIKMVEEIKNTNSLHNRLLRRYIKKHFSSLYEEILVKTAFLGKDCYEIKLNERLYCIKNNITSIPMCKNCNKNPTLFDRHKDQYNPFCSRKCATSYPDSIKRGNETKEIRYGPKKKGIYDKAKNTRYKKNNGKYHPSDFVAKVKSSKLKNHGDENYCNVEKIKETKKINHGDENWNNREKAEKTNETKYGNKNYVNVDKLRDTLSKKTEEEKRISQTKREETTFKNFGVRFILQNPDVKKKIAETNMMSLGVKTQLLLPEVRKKSTIRMKEKAFDQTIRVNKKYTPMFTKEEFVLNEDKNKLWKWKCKNCGTIFASKYLGGMKIRRCPKCEPVKYRVSQSKIISFIKSLNSVEFQNIIFDSRSIIKPYELDIFCPSRNVAIEYDGLAFHCYDKTDCVMNGKSRNYHFIKTKKCEELGIRLLHISDEDWHKNELLCKGLIRKLLGYKKYTIKSYEIKEVCEKDKEIFLTKYTFSGDDKSSIRIGCFRGNRLCSLLTLKRISSNDYKILRYATLNNFVIKDDFDNMLKYFISIYSPNIIQFNIDRRYYSPYEFIKYGFKVKSENGPCLWYMKNNTLVNPMYITIGNIRDYVDKYNSKISLQKNLLNNKYYRFFDAGHCTIIMSLENHNSDSATS